MCAAAPVYPPDPSAVFSMAELNWDEAAVDRPPMIAVREGIDLAPQMDLSEGHAIDGFCHDNLADRFSRGLCVTRSGFRADPARRPAAASQPGIPAADHHEVFVLWVGPSPWARNYKIYQEL